MSDRYIILLRDPGSATSDDPPLSATLRETGMVCVLRTRHASVYATRDTPLIHLSDGGLIIGRLFTPAGESATHAEDLAGTPSRSVPNLLQRYWGEYLALFTGGDCASGLTLLRDPSGAVPCVYALRDGEGFITSDIGIATSLGLYRREIDWQALAHGLTFPYLRTARTTLSNLKQLLPGHSLTIGRSAISTQPAWSPWHFVTSEKRQACPHDAADDVRSAVSGAIRALSRLDDSIMVELSGGLDSSIVATCVGESTPNARFCTLVMDTAGTDERPYARLVTAALSRPLVAVEVGSEHIRFDFPVLPSAVMPAVGIQQHVINEVWEATGDQHGVDSFFSGGGGDTVFCYLKTAAPATDAFLERGMMAGLTAIRELSALHQCTTWKAGRLAVRKMLRPPRTLWRADTSLLDPACIPATPDPHPWLDAPRGALPGDRERIQDLIGTQLFRDATPRGAGRAMRFPLLSQPVMEACLKVPTWMWISGGRNRAIARDAFASRLPRGVLDRRSKGSYIGYMARTYEREKEGMREFLQQGELCAHGLLDRDALSRFFAKQLAPRDLSFLRVFDLCATENWARNQSRFAS